MDRLLQLFKQVMPEEEMCNRVIGKFVDLVESLMQEEEGVPTAPRVGNMFLPFGPNARVVYGEEYNEEEQFYRNTSNKELQEFIKRNLTSFWNADHVDTSRDKFGLDTLRQTDDVTAEKIIQILVFFASAEAPIAERLARDFSVMFKHAQVNEYFVMQQMYETEHSKTYGKILNGLCVSSQEQQRRIADTPRATRNKLDWMERHIGERTNLMIKVAMMVISEGIFFQTSFALIFLIQRKNVILPGVTTANDYIAKDEANHCQFYSWLFREMSKVYLGNVNDLGIMKLFDEAVDLECQFAEMLFGEEEEFLGVTIEEMKAYIRHVGQIVKMGCGLEKVENLTCPLDFMSEYAAPIKQNFFENQATVYNSAPVCKSTLLESLFEK